MSSGRDDPRSVFWGIVLQTALRIVLVIFIAVTLLYEPPNNNLSTCAVVLAVYTVAVACWSVWALRTAARTVEFGRTVATLSVLAADVAVVSVLSVVTGLTAPDSWTSDVMRNAFFLIPVIAAAQLDPVISGVVAVPTLSAYLATCWITQNSNSEPWTSILLSSLVLAGLAGGSVALSFIQRSKLAAIGDLATQRTQLLHDLLGVEKVERQTISERLHDGALQYVLVARRDVEDLREGSTVAAERVDTALVECSQLLRDVVRELHPDVLTRLGLKAALAALSESLASRNHFAVEFDARTWPDDVSTDVDYILYSAARETLTNVIKHARAQHVWIDLEQQDGVGSLRVADDGVGTSEATMVQRAQEGHIGLSSIRAKTLASGGRFDVRSTSPGTEITIAIPLG
jgi:two-component system, NarL family, sensor kinase